MKIKNWTRTQISDRKTVWKHDKGVRIILEDVGPEYQLYLLDKAGREQYRIADTNRSILEHESSKWQRDYNSYLARGRR